MFNELRKYAIKKQIKQPKADYIQLAFWLFYGGKYKFYHFLTLMIGFLSGFSKGKLKSTQIMLTRNNF